MLESKVRGGARASVARQGGGGVRVTVWGLVGDEGAGPEVREGGARRGGGDAKLWGSEVGENDGAKNGGDLA